MCWFIVCLFIVCIVSRLNQPSRPIDAALPTLSEKYFVYIIGVLRRSPRFKLNYCLTFPPPLLFIALIGTGVLG